MMSMYLALPPFVENLHTTTDILIQDFVIHQLLKPKIDYHYYYYAFVCVCVSQLYTKISAVRKRRIPE